MQLLRELGVPPSSDCGPLVLITQTRENCHLAAQYMHSRISPGVLQQHQLRDVCAQLASHGRGVQCHYSNLPGAGKSFDIRLKAAREGLNYAHVPINNGFTSLASLVHRIKENIALAEEQAFADGESHAKSVGYLLHLDIASTVNASLARTIFGISVLGVLADSCSSSPEVYSYDPMNTIVCMELSPGLLDGALRHCEVYPLVRNVASRRTFEFVDQNLKDGMGAEYSAALNSGAVWEKQKERLSTASSGDRLSSASSRDRLSSASSASGKMDDDDDDDDDEPGAKKGKKNTSQVNAFFRLRYVCVALNLLERLKGSFPHRYQEKDGKKLLKAPNWAFNKKMYPYLAKENAGPLIPLDGARCFDLLISHSGLQNNPSLWCIWSFVNVLYWQLRDMHHNESPINNVCMPDSNQKLNSKNNDGGEKGKIKGEMLRYIIRTAREFATRQASKEKSALGHIVAAKVTGLGSLVQPKAEETRLYGTLDIWERLRYDNDGEPVFRMPTGKLYLYYRSSQERWMLDDSVNYSGSCIAESANKNMHSLFTLSSGDVNDTPSNVMTATPVQQCSDPFAFNGEAVEVRGCENLPAGSSASASENGLYLRQVPQENVNDRPLYKKDGSNDVSSRYFFVSKDKYWICGTTCNETAGVSFWSKTPSGSGASSGPPPLKTFSYFPPHKKLTDMKVQLLTATELAALRAGHNVPAAVARPAAAGGGAASSTSNGARSSSSSSSHTRPSKGGVIDLTEDEGKGSGSNVLTPEESEQAMWEAEANSMGVGSELARWKDSNHECVLFNNGESYMVKFLSLDPEQLRSTMNPVLLKHLQTSNVIVGEDLKGAEENGGDLYWEILAGLTGVKRTREEAMALMGASFCLTADRYAGRHDYSYQYMFYLYCILSILNSTHIGTFIL